MKRIIIIGSLVSCALLALTGEVQAQNGIEQVLKNIEANNKELQANAQLITSQKLEAKTDNNLPDPTLSYAHLWAKTHLGGTAAQRGRTCQNVRQAPPNRRRERPRNE